MTSPASRPLPGVRHILAGGVRVVRRGRDDLQVGLVPGRCVVVPDDAAHRDALDAFRTGDLPPATPQTHELLDLLGAHGLLRVAGPRPRPMVDIAVEGDLGVDPVPLLAAAGLRTPPAKVAAKHRTPDAALPRLLLAPAEIDRDRLDTLLREGTTHLLVRVIDGAAVLGPLVVPGETACVRCIDAHRGDDDPAHRAVLARYLETAAAPGGDPPLPAPIATLLTCWAAHELTTHVAGARPVTWSSTLAWDAAFVGLAATTWSRHPSCGCSWDAHVETSGRIGA